VNWKLDKIDNAQVGKYRVKLVITIQNSMSNPALVVQCNRPCESDPDDQLALADAHIFGYNFNPTPNPNWVVVKFGNPSPMPDGATITWWIDSADGQPINVVQVQRAIIPPSKQ
jgi:hypothetical protein